MGTNDIIYLAGGLKFPVPKRSSGLSTDSATSSEMATETALNKTAEQWTPEPIPVIDWDAWLLNPTNRTAELELNSHFSGQSDDPFSMSSTSLVDGELFQVEFDRVPHNLVEIAERESQPRDASCRSHFSLNTDVDAALRSTTAQLLSTIPQLHSPEPCDLSTISESPINTSLSYQNNIRDYDSLNPIHLHRSGETQITTSAPVLENPTNALTSDQAALSNPIRNQAVQEPEFTSLPDASSSNATLHSEMKTYLTVLTLANR